jgi:dihydropteridine reductase
MNKNFFQNLFLMTKTVLVYGGSGQLGSVVLSLFKSKQWKTFSLDFRQNEEANVNIVLDKTESFQMHSEKVFKELEKGGGNKINAVICVAGGWAGGNSLDENLIKNTEAMISQSVYSSIIASKIASTYLADDGLLALTGAKAALGSTPSMLAYGLSKAAVIQLTKSLADPSSGLPSKSKVVCVLPITLDTKSNREGMPNADFSSWTPLKVLAEEYFKWSNNESDVKSGSLIEVSTEKGETRFSVV